jgi:hypothetical protein
MLLSLSVDCTYVLRLRMLLVQLASCGGEYTLNRVNYFLIPTTTKFLGLNP